MACSVCRVSKLWIEDNFDVFIVCTISCVRYICRTVVLVITSSIYVIIHDSYKLLNSLFHVL